MGRAALLICLAALQGASSLLVEPSLLLLEEDWPVGSTIPVEICPGRGVRIAEGNTDATFSVVAINESCATIRLDAPLDADIRHAEGITWTSFSLILAESSSKSKASLDIQIVDVNDNAPVFLDPLAEIVIGADAKVGEIVGELTTLDLDTGIFGLPRYSIQTENAPVSVQRGSCDGSGRCRVELVLKEGGLTLTEPVSIIVRVQDGDPQGGKTHTTETTIVVKPEVAATTTASSTTSTTQSKTASQVPKSKETGMFPQFASILMQRISIPADVKPGEMLLSLRHDSDSDKRKFAIQKNDWLAVDESSGVVTLLKNSEKAADHEFGVKVADPSSGLSIDATLRVHFVGGTSPPTPIPSSDFRFNATYTFTVLEESMAEFIIVENLPSGVSLSLFDVPSGIPLLVHGGLLRVGRIDRDRLASERVSFIIRAFAAEKKALGEANITIIVEDENDNVPIFSQPNYTFAITKEGAAEKEGGVFIGRVRVGDEDATAPSNTVRLHSRDTRIRVDEGGNVFTTGEIDDKDGASLIRVFATDGGTPPKTTSTLIELRIIERESIEVLPGKEIVWSGQGQAGKTYSILRATAPRYEQSVVKAWIRVDEATGKLTISHDAEAPEINAFLLVKGEYDEMPADLLLTLPKNDVLAFVRSEVEVTVSNATKKGTTLAEMRMRLPAKNVTYSLSMPGFPSFLSVSKEGAVTWQGVHLPLVPYINGTITAKDGRGRQATASLRVRIDHWNKNEPVFFSASFIAWLPLPSPAGRVVPLPSPLATDGDKDDSIVYAIEGSNGFAIDRVSGKITVTKEIKKEASFELIIIARDNGGSKPFHETKAKVTITAKADGGVLNITQNLQDLDVYDEAPIGTVVVKLDTKGSTMKIVSTEKHFRVNERHEIVVAKPLTGLERTKLCAQLQASTSIVPFCVSIRKRDARPRIVSPSVDSTITIDEGTHSENLLQIELAPGSSTARFAVDNSSDAAWTFLSLSPTGVLGTKKALDYESRASLPIRVHACDSVDPSACSSLSFTIRVRDLNDHCPWFEEKEVETTLPKVSQTNPRKVVSLAAAKDGDGSEANRRTCYSVAEGRFFLVSPNLPDIYTNATFDGPTGNTVVFEVTAFDCELQCRDEKRPVNGSIVVKVKLVAANDSFPRFPSPIRHLTVVGSSPLPAGTRMAELTGSDADGEGDTLEYRIKGVVKTETTILSASDAPFAINASSGILTSTASLTSKSYVFTLVVRDGAGHEDEMDVIITAISPDQQTELVFDTPFEIIVQREAIITDLLSKTTGFTAVIDKCRQSGNATILLLHFMQGQKTARVDRAVKKLELSSSPSYYELKNTYGLRIAGSVDEEGPHQARLTEFILIGAAAVLVCLIVVFLLLWCKSRVGGGKAAGSPHGSSFLTAPFGGHTIVKQNPYWREVAVAPHPITPKHDPLQSTEL